MRGGIECDTSHLEIQAMERERKREGKGRKCNSTPRLYIAKGARVVSSFPKSGNVKKGQI